MTQRQVLNSAARNRQWLLHRVAIRRNQTQFPHRRAEQKFDNFCKRGIYCAAK